MRHVDKTALLASATPIRKGEDDDPVSVVTKSLEDLQKTVDDRLKKVEEKAASIKEPDLSAIEERLKKVETKANRPLSGKDKDEHDPIEHKALVNFLRGGIPVLDEADRKALNAGSGATGGYVTAPEYSSTIIEGITQYSPMRSLANVLSITTSKIYLPKMVTPLSGGWVSEQGARTESQPVFDQDEIEVYEHAVIVPMSQQLTEDSFIDLPGYVAGMIGKQFGSKESLAFTKGDGNGKPTGFLDDPDIFDGVTASQEVDTESGAAAFLDKLIELFYLLPEDYAVNGTWQMNRRLQGIIRKCADTTTKGTLWSDGLANGTPPSFLGRPVRENPFMDNLTDGGSPAGNTYPVAFGDWKSTYTIVDRVNIEMMNDPYTGADNGIWKLRARKRVGGKTTLPGATVLLKATPAAG